MVYSSDQSEFPSIGHAEYSLQEAPLDILSNEPLVERGQVRPDGWGSIQRQQSTSHQKEEANVAMFYVVLGVLALALAYRLIG